VLADRADHLDPPGGPRAASRMMPTGSAAAEQQQRLTALDVQLPENTDGPPSAELGSAAASIHETVSGLRVQIDATAYSAYPPRPNSRARDAVADGRAGYPGPNRVDGACCLEAEHGVRGAAGCP